jgi:hypothetical protein
VRGEFSETTAKATIRSLTRGDNSRFANNESWKTQMQSEFAALHRSVSFVTERETIQPPPEESMAMQRTTRFGIRGGATRRRY